MARCTRCVDGKTTVKMICHDGGSRTETLVEMDCIYCEGTGEDKGKVFLEDRIEWCECGPEQPTFGSYPQFGECGCGVDKEHVHCGTCGRICQLG